MKKNIIICLSMLLIGFTATAQIDRSTMPKSGPTPEIKMGKPYDFVASNGMTVLVVENHKLPRVSFSLSLDNPPHTEGEKVGVSSVASAIMGKGTKSISKDEFNEEVDFLGAFVNVNTNGGFARSLTKYSQRVFELFADAAINPNFTQDELDFEKKNLVTGIQSGYKSAAAILGTVRPALAYGKNHPAGEFATEESVNSITLADVEKYYRTYFVPANAYMVISGDIDKKTAKKWVEEYFSDWKSAKAPDLSIIGINDVQYRQINFVDAPNAVQSELAIVNIAEIKTADKDHHAALVANYILGGAFGSYLNMNLREEHGYTYGARSVLPRNNDYKVAFRATAKVRNAVTDSAVVEALKEIKRIRTEDVEEKALANAKAKFLGDFILASENDQTVANRTINIRTQNLPKDFYETFIAKINAVTKEDIKRVANKYFNPDKARIVIVGNGKEVLPNLEKIKFDGKSIPIKYYDKFATSVAKPNYEATIPEGVTVKSVLQKYIDAVGGTSKLKAVNSVFIQAEGNMQGATINYIQKRTSKKQFLQDVQVMGNSMSKQVVNNDKGFMTMQGQRMELQQDQVSAFVNESYPFIELSLLDNSGIKLTGVEKVDGKDAYVVQLTETKTAMYDVESGLKVKEITEVSQGGQTAKVPLGYSDYKEVAGIKFPFTWKQSFGPQVLELTVKEVQVNEGVSEEDFKTEK